MIRTLLTLIQGGTVTQGALFPSLPGYARGLPGLTDAACTDCGACAPACPTQVITVRGGEVALDLGGCIACGACVRACPTGTIAADRRTDVAVLRREDLVLRSGVPRPRPAVEPGLFAGSLHVREVSTGDNASDLEVAAAGNPIFDCGRFGIHVVASPRYADALVVTGPVGRAMQEPLRRCYDAMGEPRMCIAVGAAAISGGLHRGGYAGANGVDAILPVAAFVPGSPPHPWSVIHGLMLAMGHVRVRG